MYRYFLSRYCLPDYALTQYLLIVFLGLSLSACSTIKEGISAPKEDVAVFDDDIDTINEEYVPKKKPVAPPPPTHAQRCGLENTSNHTYKKRVAVLTMPLSNRQDAIDIPYVERQYPKELMRRLQNSATLIPVDATAHHRLQPRPESHRIDTILSPSIIRSAATQADAQFLVLGKIIDLSFDKSKAYGLELFSKQGWADLTQQIYEKNTRSMHRQFGIDIHVYDGPSGALLTSQRYRDSANHTLHPHKHNDLDSNIFWDSDFGELMSHTLDEQAALIEQKLECLPLRAQVISTDKDVIEINAGRNANLMPGDKLRIFHKESAGSRPNGDIKFRWQYSGEITVSAVFPLKAIATVDEELPPNLISEGDIVQAW